MLALQVIFVVFAWMIGAVVLMGLGLLILGLSGKKYLLSDIFWVGLALSVGILQLWHIFLPINLFATLTLIGIGFFGIIKHRFLLFELVKNSPRVGVWFTIIYAVALVSIAFRAVGPCEHFDTGLYGASALRWVLTYHIVPGLANVHHRLGYNSSVFLCIAALGQGPWRNLGHHLFAGLLVGGFWATAGPRFVGPFQNIKASATDWFYAILLIPCIYWTTHAHLVGAMTDLPSTIICLVAAGILFEQLDLTASTCESNARSGVRTIVAMMLLSLATTMKLSVGMFAVLAWGIGIVLLWTSNSLPGTRWKWIGGATLLCSFLVIPWILRSIILSGYPFYPIPVFGASVDWRASAFAAGREAAVVRSWARTPFAMLEETQGVPWAGAWFRRNILGREALQVPLVMSTFGLLVTVITRFRIWQGGRYLLLLIPSLGGLVFWFATAPAPRFGEAAIWTTAAVLGASSIAAIAKNVGGPRVQRMICLGIILLSAWCIAPHRLWRNVYHPLLLSDGLLPLPKANVTRVKTASGLTIFWRRDGFQCWDAPIPCTPFFDKSLQLRQEGEMQSGFKSKGPNNLSELENGWAIPGCATNYKVCQSNLPELEKRDHGSE